MATRFRKPRRKLPPRLADGRFKPVSPAKRRAREERNALIGRLLSAGRHAEAMRLMRGGSLPAGTRAPKRRTTKPARTKRGGR